MSDESLLRDVDDSLRADRLRALWRNFGPIIIGAAIAIVLIVAANRAWIWWSESTSSNSSQVFFDAIELAQDGDIAAAQEALNTSIASGTGGYPVLARFKQAGLLATTDPAAAVAAYDALSTSAQDPALRQLSLVLAANLLVDTGTLADVQARVGGLLDTPNGMRNAAREAIGLAQYKAGDGEAAATTFATIAADPEASADLVGRVQLYLTQLAAEGVVTEPATDAVPVLIDEPLEEDAPPAEAAPASVEPEAEAPAEEAASAETPSAETPASEPAADAAAPAGN